TRDVHVRCPRQALMHYPHHLPISFSQAVRPHHDPPSFPTRRSSDLIRFIRAASTTFTTEQAYSTLPGFGDKIPYYGTNIAVGWTHTFSPTVLNEVRLGFSRNQDVGVCEHCPRAPGFMASFGIKGPNGTTFQALSPS